MESEELVFLNHDDWQFEKLRESARTSDEIMESMFGNDEWQIERIVLSRKEEVIFLVEEVDTYILPSLKRREVGDLKEGKAIDILVYDEDTRDYYRLKLNYERPYYFLRNTSELYKKKGVSDGQRIGFRYEEQFATLVVKRL
ncbi:hypothetical protein SLA2020_307390 [Shorea laevis]